MADFSTFWADNLRDFLFRAEAFVPGNTRYVSAHTGDPGGSGTSEVVNGSYARVQRDSSATNWTDEATVGQTKNVAAITFPTSWAGTVSWAGMWDSATNGNFLAKAQLTTPKAVTSGDTFSFDAAALTFRFI